jgi:phosphoribosylamine--glycine ligase
MTLPLILIFFLCIVFIMKILIIGSGGREHTLAWKISQSKKVTKIFCAPGNAGTQGIAENIAIDADNVSALVEFAEKNKIDLTIVGPEGPLVAGVVDEFSKRKLKIFGPNSSAAMLEGSKAFAKAVMEKANVPTAEFHVVTQLDQAMEIVSGMQNGVVKADGLAAGKGVFVCTKKEELMGAVNKIMQEHVFGNAGSRIVIEELLEGEEASILAFCDGNTAKLMPSSQDHKRIFDNDKGPNTGGMGAYSPAPVVTKELEQRILDEVMFPVLKEMKRRGSPYVGVLYAGLMIKGNDFKVLEFNCRFGDPECQAVLPRLETDLVEVMLGCIDGKLSQKEIKWKNDAATCVVLASKGYPDKYEKGKEIKGLEKAVKLKDVFVFHAGTKKDGSKVITNGGRVLGVTGTGKTVKESIEKAYKGVALISFEGMQFRKDIGRRAIERKI